MRVSHRATVTGQADADGRLAITGQVTDSEILDNGPGGWVTRNQDFEPWSFGLEFQLPVGELQSNQKLSPRPTPVPAPAPRAAKTPVRDARAGGDAAVAESSPWGAAVDRARASAGATGEAPRTRRPAPRPRHALPREKKSRPSPRPPPREPPRGPRC